MSSDDTLASLYSERDAFVNAQRDMIIAEASKQAASGDDEMIIPWKATERIGAISNALKEKGFKVIGRTLSWRDATASTAKQLWTVTQTNTEAAATAYFTDRWAIWKSMIQDKIYDDADNIIVPCPGVFSSKVKGLLEGKGLGVTIAGTGEQVRITISFARPSEKSTSKGAGSGASSNSRKK